MNNIQRLSLAAAACLGAAWLSLHLGAHTCRIVVIDDAGQRWVAGEGSTLGEAMEGAEMPPSARAVSFPGCNFTGY